MASYMVNPSKKVFELLSQFFELDRKQVQIGLWAGDLSMSDVHLKRDAFASVLNRPIDDEMTEEETQLRLKLVSGKVGHMRVQIPWKRLVWGEGSVQLQVSDVDIVLAFESRDETRRRRKRLNRLDNSLVLSEKQKKEIALEEREYKQKWLQDAEKRQLQGLPLPPSFNEYYKRESKDATESIGDSEKEAGQVDSLLRQLTSSIMWRFAAGLQASIRNVKIVVIQDKIEIGIILQSVEIKPTKQGGTTIVTESTTMDASEIEHAESGSASADPKSSASPPYCIDDYKGEFDDGEHVDKTVDVQGLGVFLRRNIPPIPASPLHMEFSYSINFNDYVLKPTSFVLSVGFFYPYSPENKKRKKESSIPSTNKTKVTKQSPLTEYDSSTGSAKVRRGKRVKATIDGHGGISVASSQQTESNSDDMVHLGQFENDVAETTHANPSMPSLERSQGATIAHRKPTSLLPPATEVHGGRPLYGSASRFGTSRSVSVGSRANMTIQESPNFLSGTVIAPHLELQLSIQQVKTVYSSRHHHYCMLALASLKRMQRGRPSESIKDYFNSETGAAVRTIMINTPVVSRKASIPTGVLTSELGESSPVMDTFRSPSGLNPVSPPELLRCASSPIYQTQQLELKLAIAPKSSRQMSSVVVSWWKYAYNNVLREVRERRRKCLKFNPYSFKFDWDMLKYRRREYINLYLRQSVSLATYTLKGRGDDETIRNIEDELNVEQILLYRSIARALHVRGISQIGDSVVCLHESRAAPQTPHSARSESRPLRSFMRTFTTQSTGDFAINTQAPRSEMIMSPSLSDHVSIERLRNLSSASRHRCGLISTSSSAIGENHQVPGYFESPARHQQSSVVLTPANVPIGSSTPDPSKRLQKTIPSDGRTFKSALTTIKEGSDAETNSLPVRRTKRLRFSVTFELEHVEILVMKDVSHMRSFDTTSLDESDPERSVKLDISNASSKDGAVSSDEISYLTDDGNYDENLVAEGESESVVIMEDFLAIDKSSGVVLDVSIRSLHFFCAGLSGGSKRLSFCIGSIRILGDERSELLSVGSANSQNLRDSFSIPEINIMPSRKRSLSRSTSPRDQSEALRLSFFLMENHENFLEVDLAKVSLAVEAKAFAALRRVFETSVPFPRQLLERNGFDVIRDYLLKRSGGRCVLGPFESVDCAIRCHGFDILIPSLELSDVSEKYNTSNPSPGRKVLRATLVLVECYTGSLVEQICMSLNRHQDESSHYSGYKTTGVGSVLPDENADQGLKLLNIPELSDRLSSLNSRNAIFSVSALDISLEVPSIVGSTSFDCIPLLRECVDIEIFLASLTSNSFVGENVELAVAVSPVELLFSNRRQVVVTEVLACLMSYRSASDDHPVDKKPYLAPPRLQGVSESIIASVFLSIVSIAVEIVSDVSGAYQLSLADQEIIVEEAISDYLSFFACFDQQHSPDEAIQHSRSICINRLIGAGFKPNVAFECVASAGQLFMEDIELVRATQVDALQDLADFQGRAGDSLRDDVRVSLSPDEDAANAVLEDNSEESLDILETAIQNAVEQTLSAYLNRVQGSLLSNPTILSMQADKGLYARATKFFYDSHLVVDVPSLNIENGAGIRIVSVCGGGLGVVSETDQPNPKNNKEIRAILLSVFHQDCGFDFAQGGSLLSVLGDNNNEVVDRRRECLTLADVGILELHVCSKVLVSVMSGLEEFRGGQGSTLGENRSGLVEPSGPRNALPLEYSHSIEMNKLSVVLFSDDMNPFTKVKFLSIRCIYKTDLFIEAKDIFLINLTPEGQYFPLVLRPLEPRDRQESAKNLPVFRLTYFPSPAIWKRSSRLHIELSEVQITFLNQYVSELVQFTVCMNGGVGELLARREVNSLVDDNGNPPPPLMLMVLVTDSSLILPRSIASPDLIGIEFGSMEIVNSFHLESFKLANADEKLRKGEAHGLDHDFPETTLATSTSPMEFYDCIGHLGEDQTTISSFLKNLILRYTITFTSANMYAALPPKNTKLRATKSDTFLSEYQISGRASDGAKVFSQITSVRPSEGQLEPEHIWECISKGSFSLEILMDFAPKIRVLISDIVTRAETISSIDLDVRMSQFYLLLSVWFDNMQDLPSVFPLSAENVKLHARGNSPPSDFPEYGSEEYVKWLLRVPRMFTSDIACHFTSIAMRCEFDPCGYFELDPSSLSGGLETNAFSLSLKHCVVHVTSDEHAIMRIGCGAQSFCILDERKPSPFNQFVRVEGVDPTPDHVWADLSFGLEADGTALDKGALHLPLQATVFMSPGWTLVNLGVETLDSVMTDFSPIWMLLDFFSSYFSSGAFGYPLFEAVANKERLVKKLESAQSSIHPVLLSSATNVDFRLWLFRPFLCVSSETSKIDAPCLMVKSDRGFWYQFKSMASYSSQEMGSTDLSIEFTDQFRSRGDGLHNGNAYVHNRARGLVEHLSFGLRMDFNRETHHTDYAFCIPMWRIVDKPSSRCKITSPALEIDPVQLPRATVCRPTKSLEIDRGMVFSEITVIIEVLPQASAILSNWLGLGNEARDETGMVEPSANGELTSLPESSFTISARIENLRFFVLDPTLGVHLPLAMFTLSMLKISSSRLGTKFEVSPDPPGDCPPSDMQLVLVFSCWADYFKLGTTRSWEPLIEPFGCTVLYDKSNRRGEGVTISTEQPFHVNVTGALLLTLDDAIGSLARAFSETFGEGRLRVSGKQVQPGTANDCVVHQMLVSPEGTFQVNHQIPFPLSTDERIAFSFLNLTGQRIRVHQLSQSAVAESEFTSIVTYLQHSETTRLEFQATVSVIQNLRLIDVPYPGVSHSQYQPGVTATSSHCVDIQLPGFKWLEGVSVDTAGRRFDDIVPRSPAILSKVSRDWRLKNIMKVLTEVGLDNGGRVITVRSLFEVRNHTTHSINVLFHPDPRHKPLENGEDESSRSLSRSDMQPELSPGGAFQIPILLLEAALRVDGKHLGSLWMKPSQDVVKEGFLASLRVGNGCLDQPRIGFSSRPVQLAKLVHESAILFQEGRGADIPPDKARSGIECSCPIADGGNSVPVAPFCYSIEVRRSPLVKAQQNSPQASAKKVNFAGINKLTSQINETRKEASPTSRTPLPHLPVAYTLIIHPPLVIENLLPARGRFELMHATRRTVLWFSDLEPGETVSVHTVGLDAPLLLLINLGFCRTPVGEGALVHHGSEAKGSITPVGLKFIGKAVTQGTRHIGKTLTIMSDSPDRRGKGKLNLIQNPQYYQESNKRLKHDIKMAGGAAGSLGIDNDVTRRGRVHVVDERIYDADEIATETIVVDGVGQKLTLKIENIRGGGGQRRIALFCPFWMVNTTEHALRYKQEKCSSFIAGTVSSPEFDGSKTVDRSRRNLSRRIALRARRGARHLDLQSSSPMDYQTANLNTVFSGTPGAIANIPGRRPVSQERLAKLLQSDLPLEELASIAFMFNFQEDSLLIGQQRVVVQLADGTNPSSYTSDWSQGFSLDTVGVPQLIGMHCKDGRVLELSVTISVAPDFLARYTKIVRFTPRYIIVNRLNQPIRIWQDSSILHAGFDNRDILQSRKDSPKWRLSRGNIPLSTEKNYVVLFGGRAEVEEITHEGFSLGTTVNSLALYIVTIAQDELVPFHLPDTRGDRQFRIDLGNSWNLSPRFDADIPGDHTFKPCKALDLRLLRHVNTRASPHYKITFPPVDGSEWDGELGVWFETAWGGDRKILVKGTKRGRYAFNNTDIRVGDELLRVDNIVVSQLTFAETMKLLKERLAQTAIRPEHDVVTVQRNRVSMRNRRHKKSSRLEVLHGYYGSSNPEDERSVVLTFRTLEERLRRVRVKASNTSPSKKHTSDATTGPVSLSGIETENERRQTDEDEERDKPHVKVELRAIYNSMFIVVREQNTLSPPYRIQNRAMSHFILFRQRGCSGYPWNVLQPGESNVYCWEEPTKPHKLTLRVGAIYTPLNRETGEDEVCSQIDTEAAIDICEPRHGRQSRLKQFLSVQSVDGEDQAGFGIAVTVKLDEIGFTCELPCPRRNEQRNSEKVLSCCVDSNGATRVLLISNNRDEHDDKRVLERHIGNVQKCIDEERSRIAILQSLTSNLTENHLYSDVERSDDKNVECLDISDNVWRRDHSENASSLSQIEEAASALADFPEDCTIWRRHQIVIQVLEAAGLSSADVINKCNPYCEIILKGSRKSKSLFSHVTAMKKTYFVEGTFSPKWVDQTFVFDVPPAAVEYTREHAILVRIRSFRLIGQHPYLGQTTVHLRTLRNQCELVGWYPLVGRSGHRDLEDVTANWGKGSVQLRVQWVFTVPALVTYFLMLSENRLHHLQRTHEGLINQLENQLENEAQRNRLKKHEISKEILRDPFGIATRFLLHRNLQSSSWPSPGRKRSRLDNSEGQPAWPLLEPLKMSRAKLLWLFNFQTQQSRRARNASWTPELSDPLQVSMTAQGSGPGTSSGVEFLRRENKEPCEDVPLRSRLLSGSILPLDENLRPIIRSDKFDDEVSRQVNRFPLRPRTLSFEDIVRSFEVLGLTRRGASSRQSDATASDDKGSNSLRGVMTVLTPPIAGGAERSLAIEALFHRGFLYHRGRSTFHRNHLTYCLRLALIEGTNARKRPKSRQRISHSEGSIMTWIAARVALYDPALIAIESSFRFKFSLVDPKQPATVSELPNIETATSPYTKTPLGGKMAVSLCAPAEMRKLLLKRAERFDAARTSFSRICMDSMKAALHPGGVLVVRPITVLNLPQSFPGMSVKIRLGSFALSTNTADARVAPVWAPERSRVNIEKAVSFFAHCESFEKIDWSDASVLGTAGIIENDLSIPVDPQQTSGSIRLAVIGERLNTRVELGVLDIPLGAAIRCCVDGMDQDLNDNRSTVPFEYVRWFPLRHPKDDSADVEGDKGYVPRPLDTEQETDTHFGQYFTPCIRLALLWCPTAPDMLDNNKDDMGSEAESSTPLTRMYCLANIARISSSLIDSQLRGELLAFCASDIGIKYFDSKAMTRLGFVVGWIQVDNQVVWTKEPVVLAPTPVVHPNPTLQFLVYKDNLRSKGKIDSYELIAFYMEELDLTIEEGLVLEVWDFIVSIGRRREVKRRASNFKNARFLNELIKNMKFASPQVNSSPSLLELLWEDETSDAKAYIEKLYLGPVRVNLTYIKGRRGQQSEFSHIIDEIGTASDVFHAVGLGRLRISQKSGIFDLWTEFTHDEDLLNDMGEGKSLPNLLASVLPSVSEAPIRLQGKGLSFIFEDKNEIINSLKAYYVTETLKQIYKIIGSLDFVGNPVMVVSSFANGLRDFFIEPSKQFRKSPNSPSRLGLGVAKGTLSLVSHSASGLFGFAAKMSATAGQAAAIFTFDSDFQLWHREHVLSEAKNLDRHWKRRGVGGVSRVFTRPIIDLVRGVVLGTTGLVLSPIKEVRKDGLSGLARGVAIGAIGVLAKPTVGLLDALSHFTGSIHDVAKSVNVLDKRYEPARRLRLPYTFSVQNVLIPFNRATAESVLLLKKFPPNRSLETSAAEVHVASEVFSVESGVQTFVIISTLRIVLIKIKLDGNGVRIPSLSWEVSLTPRNKVSSRISAQGHNGVALTIIVISSPLEDTRNQDLRVDATKRSRESTDEFELPFASDVASLQSRDDPVAPQSAKSAKSPSWGSNDHLSGASPVVNINGQVDTKFFNEEDQDHMHHSMMANSGESIDFFTVLAEFDHRRQLCRLHNAICCIAGNMDSIIRDRGIGVAGGTEGYTSFGEFVFSEVTSSVPHRLEQRTTELEFVPWIPCVIFDSMGSNRTINSDDEFRSMRRKWKLENEYQASEALGGPKWLVRARAEATFTPERAPFVPNHLAEEPSIQEILQNYYSGAICYEQAEGDITLAVESTKDKVTEKMTVPIPSDNSFEALGPQNNFDRHIHTYRESLDDFKTTVGSLVKLSEVTTIESSIPPHDVVSFSKEDLSSCSDEIDGDGTNIESSSAKVDRLKVYHTGNTTIPATQGAGSPAQSLHGRYSITEMIPATPRNSDQRMNHLELMLEKLVEVSLANAQQFGFMSRERTDSALFAVRDELASLRLEMEKQRSVEDERVQQLRSDIADLQKQLNGSQEFNIRRNSEQSVADELNAISNGIEVKHWNKQRSNTVQNVRRKLSLLSLKRGKPFANTALHSINENEDMSKQLEGKDNFDGLDDFHGLDDYDVTQDSV